MLSRRLSLLAVGSCQCSTSAACRLLLANVHVDQGASLCEGGKRVNESVATLLKYSDRDGRIDHSAPTGFGINDSNQTIILALPRIHRWTRTEGVRTLEGGVRKLQTRWPGLEFG